MRWDKSYRANALPYIRSQLWKLPFKHWLRESCNILEGVKTPQVFCDPQHYISQCETTRPGGDTWALPPQSEHNRNPMDEMFCTPSPPPFDGYTLQLTPWQDCNPWEDEDQQDVAGISSGYMVIFCLLILFTCHSLSLSLSISHLLLNKNLYYWFWHMVSCAP